MKVRSQQIQIGQARCIVIADIHGKRTWLQRLLKKIHYQAERDHLVILGDMIEKGEESLATLQYVMELAEYANVHVVKGNCDQIPCELFYKEKWEQIHQYQLQIAWKEHTLLYEMAQPLQITWDHNTNMQEFVKGILSTYHKEFAFLSSLPHVLESEQYLFVHAGIETETAPYAQNAYTIMKNDRFASGAHHFQKTLICGHTPVVNYDDNIANYGVRIDDTRNIISIDGGCGIKEEGQLNALLLEQGKVTYEYVDDLPLYEVRKDWIPKQEDSLNIHWFSKPVEVVKYRQGDVICRHISSGVVLSLPASSIYEIQGEYYANDFTNYQIPLKKGEQVGFISTWHTMVLIKHQGVIGWVPHQLLIKV